MIDNKTKLNGDFSLNSRITNKNYDTNVFETINTNDLKFISEPKISQKGFYNNYEFLVRNTNTKANNSKLVKNKEVEKVINFLQKNNFVYKGKIKAPAGEDDDNWVEREQLLFKSTDFGDDKDRALQKSDGTWTYFASDVA